MDGQQEVPTPRNILALERENGAGRVLGIAQGIEQDHSLASPERRREGESDCAAVEDLDVRGSRCVGELAQRSDAHCLVREQLVAEPDDEIGLAGHTLSFGTLFQPVTMDEIKPECSSDSTSSDEYTWLMTKPRTRNVIT